MEFDTSGAAPRERGQECLETYRATNAAQARGEPITPAAQWPLTTIIWSEETIFQIKRDLPRRFLSGNCTTVLRSAGGEVLRAPAVDWAYRGGIGQRRCPRRC